MIHEWENIETDSIDSTMRLLIYGGWLVKTKCTFRIQDKDGWHYDYRHSLTFVPDLNHDWDINKKYEHVEYTPGPLSPR